MYQSIESRTRKYVRGYRVLSFAKNLSNKCRKKLLDTGLHSLKTASRKVIHKTAEFLGKKIADVVTNSYDDKSKKTKPVEEIIIPQE